MARKLSPTEFYQEFGSRCNMDLDRAQFVWENFCEMLSDELLMYGSIFLPFLGEMTLQTRGGKNMFMPVSPKLEDRGKIKQVYMEPYQKVQFLPSNTLKDIINKDGTPQAVISRQREIYRKMKQELEEQEKQFALLQRAENAALEMRKKKEAKIERKKRQKLTEEERKQQIKTALKTRRDNELVDRTIDYW